MKRELPKIGPLPLDFDLGSVAYGGGQFAAVGGSQFGNVAIHSTNGVDWSYGNISGYGFVEEVTYGAGRFVAICYRDWYGSYSCTSTDGVNWGAAYISSTNLYSIAYGDGIFVSVGASGLVMTSPDGLNWTQQTSGVTNNAGWSGIAYGSGEFVAVAGGLNAVWSSINGSNWIAHATCPYVSSLTYAGNHFIGVGVNGAILESDAVRIPLEARLEPSRSTAGGPFRFTLSGSSDQSYLVQTSTNLSRWTPLLDVTASASASEIEDPSATNCALRFYRAIVP
ncbi:MAG: hypothetical protein NT167_00870 [Verrucomicrobia bacterium]|nr:hypothetical protein [Verrucomicrobiota bacterium]